MSSTDNLPPCVRGMRAEHKDFPCCDGATCDLNEAAFWSQFQGDWQCLHSGYCQTGLSVEWHDVICDSPNSWSSSFHPGSLELCLNVSGRGRLIAGKTVLEVLPMTVAWYVGTSDALKAVRVPGERHRFLTLEFSPGFLQRHLKGRESGLHPFIKNFVGGHPAFPPMLLGGDLTLNLLNLVEQMRKPIFSGVAGGLWYESHALALMAEFFCRPEQRSESTGTRRERTSRARVESAVQILKRDLANPPSLAQLGQLAGCSQYYLSRTFSREMGMTIPQYIRRVRMEAAAEMLKSGKFNVTEAASRVGYSSLSHFSQAFCDVIGCCPGLYPLGLSRSKLLPAFETSLGRKA